MIEVRLNAPRKGLETVDEIVGENCFVHIEQMGGAFWFVTISDGEREIGVWLGKMGTYEDRGKVPADRSSCVPGGGGVG